MHARALAALTVVAALLQLQPALAGHPKCLTAQSLCEPLESAHARGKHRHKHAKEDGPTECCKGTTCVALDNGEGYSLCLPPDFTPFGQFQNLDTLSIQPNNAAVDATAAVVFMHGLGMTKESMSAYVFGLLAAARSAARIDLQTGEHIKFVFPDGPAFSFEFLQLVTNVTQPARGWFDIVLGTNAERMFGLPFKSNDEHIAASTKYIQGIVRDLIAGGMHPSRIVVAGYSEGGAVALQTALTFETELAGAVSLASAFIPPAEPTKFKDVPVFIGHGFYDLVVPYYVGQLTARVLNPATPESSPYTDPIPPYLSLRITDVTLKGYPIVSANSTFRNHDLSPEMLADVWNFIVAKVPRI